MPRRLLYLMPLAALSFVAACESTGPVLVASFEVTVDTVVATLIRETHQFRTSAVVRVPATITNHGTSPVEWHPGAGLEEKGSGAGVITVHSNTFTLVEDPE
jgi:hypothetical protein